MGGKTVETVTLSYQTLETVPQMSLPHTNTGWTRLIRSQPSVSFASN